MRTYLSEVLVCFKPLVGLNCNSTLISRPQMLHFSQFRFRVLIICLFDRSFSRKRRMSMKMAPEGNVVVGKSTTSSSPTFTHVVTKKRSRLTSSMCELETAGNTADTNDDETNENVDDLKCMPSPGSKSKACKFFFRYSSKEVLGSTFLHDDD